MSKKVMKLLDVRTGLMECKICGNRHYANLLSNDQYHTYHRGSWQCQNGCKIE